MRLNCGRDIQAFDFLVVRKIVGDVPGPLALAILLNHLRNLRHNHLLSGGCSALSIEFAGPFDLLLLGLS